MILAQRDIYTELLNSQVLKEDIHELLKTYKDAHKDDITLSGNKLDNVNNLLDAVEKNIIPATDLQILIKDSEEFGDQYIYLYEPINKTISQKYNDGNSIIDSIVSQSIKLGFPKLTIKPTKFEWADFRSPYRGVKNTWLLKMYDRKVREIKIDDKYDISKGQRVVTFERTESRLIYLIEWTESEQLEIKISRTSFDSAKSLNESIKLIRNKIYNGGQGINPETEIKYVDLTDCVNNILKKSEDNEKIYKLISVTLIDSQFGRASIRAFDDQGQSDLLSEGSRKQAIEAYLNGNGKADGVVVRFLADGSNGELKSDINVIIGRDGINQIIIPAKIKPQEYKYVRRKIAEFS
ncbi:hypothetical protein [Flavobacterium sp. WC2509]|uniref:hypothetical protein n=1 Tax=Flavobacterium sp. WC2509 TaxID=3461406 RepID=UPI0040446724